MIAAERVHHGLHGRAIADDQALGLEVGGARVEPRLRPSALIGAADEGHRHPPGREVAAVVAAAGRVPKRPPWVVRDKLAAEADDGAIPVGPALGVLHLGSAHIKAESSARAPACAAAGAIRN